MKRFFGILLVLLALMGGLGYYHINKELEIVNKNSLNDKPLSRVSKKDLKYKLKHKQSVNFLLFGVDTGALKRHFKGRSDTIMLLSINPKTNKSLLISIPRDTASIMPGQTNAGLAKINTAYVLGGPQMMGDVIYKQFKVPLDGYAVINMGGLEGLLKAVGGVRVKSNLTFTQDWYHFKKGHYYHLHGKKALAYIRERHEDPLGDYGRQIRQRQVLKALTRKLVKPKVLLNTEIVKNVSKNVKSDIDKKDLITLLRFYLKTLKYMSTDHAQGEAKDVYNMNYGLMEVEKMPQKERDRITHKVQKHMNAMSKTK